MSFRWFADVAPEDNSIIIKIQKNRKETPQSLQINADQNLDALKKILKEAYETIR